MKIHDVQQGTAAWLELRAGIPTASELDNLISPTGEIRTGGMPRSYVALKLAEQWTGAPIVTFSGGAMEQGTIKEDEAVPYFSLTLDVDIQRVGFCTTDDGAFGCSPDGLTPGSGIEIKCPLPHTHCLWLLGGVCPKDHLLQVHGAMFVTGADRWTFASYCRGFPPLVVVVERCPATMKKIGEVVARVTREVAAGMHLLTSLNGGPPRRAPVPAPREQPDHNF